MIGFDARHAQKFLSQDAVAASRSQLTGAIEQIRAKSGAGNDFLGWTEVGKGCNIERIKAAAAKIRLNSQVLVVIGIGGSYMGAKSAIDFLRRPDEIRPTEILFAGNNMSADELSAALKYCADKEIAVNVVSKSGTTTEPAIAFRLFTDLLERKYGDKAGRRIFVTTDQNRGTLKELADAQGYETFVVPDDVGGRYSVLTDVGLLPIAVAGYDIDALLTGAKEAMARYLEPKPEQNEAAQYAAYRHALYNNGKVLEILTGYEPHLYALSLWWQQLFGESHGKEEQGIFPVALTYTQDLHSMGQYLQQGIHNNFETVLWVEQPFEDLTLCASRAADGLDYLEGKSIHYINSKAFEGVIQAHVDGGTANLVVTLPRRDERTLGWLYVFFEISCAIGGYLLGVNPFDQPGVEDYKRNMFRLLGKPGK